ncbi:unnamed protein product [Rotaria sordida]|uniref:Uncharacterized protein n=1 Tax=Rotaria sordida TaxID=392033 RepID=A0A813N3B5_9BILA|nr:unnamed protein product [Rotaria sordida]
MTHNDYECLHKIRYRWQKEQQLIRKKYQIPYNMTYISKQCFNKYISITSKAESNNLKTKIDQLDKHSFNIKYCSKCHLNLTQCSCSNQLNQCLINLKKKSYSTDKISKISSINFLYKQPMNSDSSLINISSNERTNSIYNKKQYVLLDWNNRQSLMNFIRTTQLNKNLSNMTIEQLHELIIHHDHIHIFHSIIDLICSMNKKERQEFLCHIYIDPFYYSTIQDTIPLFQSKLIADNINLDHVLHSIKKLAFLLGIKFDQSINKILPEKLSIKQRQSILNQQSLFIASKIPYNTFVRAQ